MAKQKSSSEREGHYLGVSLGARAETHLKRHDVRTRNAALPPEPVRPLAMDIGTPRKGDSMAGVKIGETTGHLAQNG